MSQHIQVDSLHEKARDLIAAHAKSQIMRIDPSWTHFSKAALIINQTVEAMNIMHRYYVEPARDDRAAHAPLLDQLQDLLDSLLSFSGNGQGRRPVGSSTQKDAL